MRLLTFLTFGLFLVTFPAQSQEEMPVYRVTDVIVDVASANASIARDVAIGQAQRQAFVQLLERLGAPTTVIVANDEVASLVQSFEIQKEHAAGMRYLGTFSVQFKPDLVRNFLNNKGVNYVEARAKPVVVLPVLRSNGRDIMWEDMTPWHAAWAEHAKKAGLVPIIVPQADLDDIAKIGPVEALAGTQENLRAIMQKYQASGVFVALLQADLDLPNGKSEAVADVYRYDFDGHALEPIHLKLPTLAATKTVSDDLSKGVYQIIGQVERGWRQSNQAPSGPSSFLPVDVAVATLAAWSQIQTKLRHATPVAGAHVVTMTRGLVHAEIEYRGDILELQKALTAQGLTLTQNPYGGWELKANGE